MDYFFREQVTESASDKRLSDRNFLRFRCDHYLKEAYSRLGENENNKFCVFETLVKKIAYDYEATNALSTTNSLELLISYIVVASSPYLSFRKSCREAIFALIQILFEVSLHKEVYDYEKEFSHQVEETVFLTPEEKNEFRQMLNCEALNYVVELVRSVPPDAKAKRDLVKVLIKQSVELRSNFIIRKENIIRLIRFSVENRFDEMEIGQQSDENKKDVIPFVDYYLYYVKKLIAIGTDEAKAMFLEYLLLSGDECNNDDCAIALNSQFGEKFLQDAKEYISRSNAYSDDVKDIMSQLRTLLCNLYLENTQIIFDAATDLYNKRFSNNNLTDPYYLDNFYKLLEWNIIDSKKITEELIMLKGHLNSSSESNGGVLVYFNKLSTYISKLLSVSMSNSDAIKPSVYFISERDEDVLTIDEERGNIVRSTKLKAWDCFACNDESQYQEYINGYGGKISVVIKNAQAELEPLKKACELSAKPDSNIHNQSKFVLSTYLESENDNFYILNLSETSREKDKNDELAYTPFIRMIISFEGTCTDYQKLKAIRYILAFRHQICMKKDAYLKNDLLLSHLHDIAAKKQMQKARAGEHDNESDFAQYSPRNYVESIHLNQQSKESFYYEEMNALFGYYVNATIGRINIKLLADSDITTSSAESEHLPNDIDFVERNNVEILTLCKKLSAIKHLPMIRLANFFDGSAMKIAPENFYDYFIKVFKAQSLLRNELDQIPKLDYIVAFIAEQINSAIKYSPPPHDISFLMEDDGYFYISNKLQDDSQIHRIYSGLRRENDGISLATICGFFDRFYIERKTQDDSCINTPVGSRVKILHKSGFLSFGLPLFKGDKNNEFFTD